MHLQLSDLMFLNFKCKVNLGINFKTEIRRFSFFFIDMYLSHPQSVDFMFSLLSSNEPVYNPCPWEAGIIKVLMVKLTNK